MEHFQVTKQQIASLIQLLFFNIKIEKSSNAYSYKPPNMPLVVPGLMSSAGSNNEQESWMNKLVGKKLTDSTSDTTVRLYVLQ